MSNSIPRNLYADMYGPTKGDKVRLADTFVTVFMLAAAPLINTPSGSADVLTPIFVDGLPSETASPSMLVEDNTLAAAVVTRTRL